MIIPMETELPPLRLDENGDYRVGRCRVLLDMVVHEYHKGSTPEKIVDSFSTLDLADVYGVISFYLKHRGDVDAYLDWRDREGDRIRAEIEKEQGDQSALRDRLLARRNLLGASNVAVAER